MVAGFVHDAAGHPVPGAAVSVQWLSTNTTRRAPASDPRKATARTDDDGRFIFCGLPVGQPITLTARHGGAEAALELRIERAGITRTDLRVTGDP